MLVAPIKPSPKLTNEEVRPVTCTTTPGTDWPTITESGTSASA